MFNTFGWFNPFAPMFQQPFGWNGPYFPQPFSPPMSQPGLGWMPPAFSGPSMNMGGSPFFSPFAALPPLPPMPASWGPPNAADLKIVADSKAEIAAIDARTHAYTVAGNEKANAQFREALFGSDE